MKITIFLFFSYLSILTAQAAVNCEQVTEIPNIECEALVTLYENTEGARWKRNAGWNVTNTPCSWADVKCSNGHVSSIDLHSNRVKGTIPSILGNLNHLLELNLGKNQLTGSIPPTLGNLSNLLALNLGKNQLTGSIPSALGNLSNLQKLYLNKNQLNNSIPLILGNLTNLQVLNLGNNQLSGSIPLTLGHLGELQTLNLERNQLSGQIPPVLGNLSNLQNLILKFNQLSGSIPSTLGNLSDLQQLHFESNQLSGLIPPILGSLNNLQKLDLESNQISGPIPSTLGNLSNLRRLDLHKNQLSGTIPLTLSKLNNLQGLDLGANQLCGDIPSQLMYLPNLSILELFDNALNNQNLSAELVNFLNKFNSTWQNQNPAPITCQTPSPHNTTVVSPYSNLTIDFGGSGNGHVSSVDFNCDDTHGKCVYTHDTATWVFLTATPAADSFFLGWGGHHDCVDGELFLMGSTKCTAYFDLLPTILTVTILGEGKVHLYPNAIERQGNDYIFEMGTKVALTTSPANDWQFKQWQGDCDQTGHVVMAANKACQIIFVPKDKTAQTTDVDPQVVLTNQNHKPELLLPKSLHVMHDLIILPDTHTFNIVVDVAEALIELTNNNGDILATAWSVSNETITIKTLQKGIFNIFVTKSGYLPYQGVLLAPTVVSNGQGRWEKTPESDDIAVVQSDHTVVIERYGNFVKADILYIEEGGILQGNADKRLTVLANYILNYGEIRGASGIDGGITLSGEYVYATYGKSVVLKADKWIVNGETGKISAGHHGQNFFYNRINNAIKEYDRNTGWVEIDTPTFINKGQVIPEANF